MKWLMAFVGGDDKVSNIIRFLKSSKLHHQLHKLFSFKGKTGKITNALEML